MKELNLMLLLLMLSATSVMGFGGGRHGGRPHHDGPRGGGDGGLFDRVLAGLRADNKTELASRLEPYRGNFLNNTAPADRTGLDAAIADLRAYAQSSQDAHLRWEIEGLAQRAQFAPERDFHHHDAGHGGDHLFDKVLVGLQVANKTDLAARLEPYRDNFANNTAPANRADLDAVLVDLKAFAATLVAPTDAHLKREAEALIQRADFSPRPPGPPRHGNRGRERPPRPRGGKVRWHPYPAGSRAKRQTGDQQQQSTPDAQMVRRSNFEFDVVALRYGGQGPLADRLAPFRPNFEQGKLPLDPARVKALKTAMTQVKQLEAKTEAAGPALTQAMKQGLMNLMKMYESPIGGTYNNNASMAAPATTARPPPPAGTTTNAPSATTQRN